MECFICKIKQFHPPGPRFGESSHRHMRLSRVVGAPSGSCENANLSRRMFANFDGPFVLKCASLCRLFSLRPGLIGICQSGRS